MHLPVTKHAEVHTSEQPAKRQRRTLSCLPCRLQKLRCNRSMPCQNCCRHGREEQCRLNPPPEAASAALPANHSAIPVQRNTAQPAESPSHAASMRPVLPLTPSSGIACEGELAQKRQECHQRQYSNVNPTTPLSRSWQPQHGSPYTTGGNLVAATGNSRTVASALLFRSTDMTQRCLLDEPATFWKQYLVGILPSQTQCDMFVSYFFENLNWMYQSIHGPSFRNEYAGLWDSDVEDVDLIWLALLFMILGLGAFFAPSSVAEAVGLKADDLPRLHHRWYAASRQALQAGGHDSKPTLTAIQVFIISQSYWYCNKNVEALNSHMGQTVRNAQALGLDKEAPRSITDCVEREMRHRIWWDLVSSDTFQSLCLGRPTLLQPHLSTVPFPSNCNDVDMTPTSVYNRPISEATEMSVHCFRAQLFRVFNKLYIDNGSHLSSYDFVAGIDAEITEIMETFPWYLKDDAQYVQQQLPPSLATVVTWMRHVLQSAICIQRVRMYRPFLNPVAGDSWQRCVTAGTSALAIYKSLRAQDMKQFQRCQKMHVQAYQVFSVAVALSTFLLVEMPSNPQPIRADIELVIEDLSSHSSSVDDSRWIPLISDGCRVIRRMLTLYDARCKRRQASSTAVTSDDSALQEEARTALVPAISSVFGGETSARRYLERCFIENIVNDPVPANTDSSPAVGFLDLAAWDTLLNPAAQLGQWSDAFWTDMDACIGLSPVVS